MCSVMAGGVTLSLLADKAVWLHGSRTLLVADVHLGKAASFRRQGVPVPHGTTAGTLARLGALLAAHATARVVFLGDLLHSAHVHDSGALRSLRRWREAHAAVELVLVRGNHDGRAGDPPAALGIACVDEPWLLDGLALCHHPREIPGAYALAGHLHPCISVGGRAHDRLRLPCFWFGPRTGVLPAFGEFTGMHRVLPVPGDRVYAVADDGVHALPVAAR